MLSLPCIPLYTRVEESYDKARSIVFEIVFGEGGRGLQTNPKNPNLFANVQHSEGGGGAMSQVPKTSILMLIIPPSTCSMQEKI